MGTGRGGRRGADPVTEDSFFCLCYPNPTKSGTQVQAPLLWQQPPVFWGLKTDAWAAASGSTEAGLRLEQARQDGVLGSWVELELRPIQAPSGPAWLCWDRDRWVGMGRRGSAHTCISIYSAEILLGYQSHVQ
jgi:hypothetical protein